MRSRPARNSRNHLPLSSLQSLSTLLADPETLQSSRSSSPLRVLTRCLRTTGVSQCGFGCRCRSVPDQGSSVRFSTAIPPVGDDASSAFRREPEAFVSALRFFAPPCPHRPWSNQVLVPSRRIAPSGVAWRPEGIWNRLYILSPNCVPGSSLQKDRSGRFARRPNDFCKLGHTCDGTLNSQTPDSVIAYTAMRSKSGLYCPVNPSTGCAAEGKTEPTVDPLCPPKMIMGEQRSQLSRHEPLKPRQNPPGHLSGTYRRRLRPYPASSNA